MDSLSRRQFVAGAAGLGLVAGCGRWPGQAEHPARVSRIGLLFDGTDEKAADPRSNLHLGLSEFGHREGHNILVEYRFADGNRDRLPALASELATLPLDAIVAVGTTAAVAAKAATSTIPIVITAVADPIGTGLVSSLAHPGGNVTGVSLLSPQLAGKRLEFVLGASSGATRVAMLRNPANPATALTFRQTQEAASTLGVELLALEVQQFEDLERAFQMATAQRADAIVVIVDTLILQHQGQVVDLAAQRQLPAMYTVRELVDVGGLMAYGANLSYTYRRAAYYVDRILKRTKPADLPIEQPMVFDFVVNMKTAQALGITFPNEILLQVTEVIQ
jgi:putative tryptophan/tyrosine transport system substrate-binding protein